MLSTTGTYILPSRITEAKSTDEFKKLLDNLNNDIMFSIDL